MDTHTVAAPPLSRQATRPDTLIVSAVEADAVIAVHVAFTLTLTEEAALFDYHRDDAPRHRHFVRRALANEIGSWFSDLGCAVADLTITVKEDN